MLITHDPHLVELIADRLWLVADGTVRPFDGDLDDYRALLARAGSTFDKDRRDYPQGRSEGTRRGPSGCGADAENGPGR